jgi:hypothetical protein
MGMSGNAMRQSIDCLAAIAAIAVTCRPVISPAAIQELPAALKASALAPFDALVDWMETAYGGPIDPGQAQGLVQPPTRVGKGNFVRAASGQTMI